MSVDDDLGILFTRQRILEIARYRVLNAEDGDYALRIFEGYSIDLVLLDYEMPGMNGGNVAREMKARNPPVPVILVTASPILRGTELRAECLVAKGEGPALLLEKINQFLRCRFHPIGPRSS